MSDVQLESPRQLETLPSRRSGLRARCSFLLNVIADEDVTDSERSVAAISLAADVDAYREVLGDGEARRVSECLEVFGVSHEAGNAWSHLLLPDPSTLRGARIDGLNVRRAIVEPSNLSDGATLAVLELPRGGRFVAVNEYTCSPGTEAELTIVDADSDEVLASHALQPGHHRSKSTEFVTDSQLQLRLQLSVHSGDDPIHWYGAHLESLAPPALPSATARARSVLQRVRRENPDSIFGSVTGEPLALADIDRMMGLRNRFSGERVFVMGNGPSLNRTPLDKLDGEYVFGVNRISLLLERVSWIPTFFTAFDVRVVPDNADEFREIDIPYKFFSARYKKLMEERSNHYWYHTKGFYEGFGSGFEPTVPFSGFGGGGSIGVMAVQLAFFMGFREIYLIGTDVSYTIPETVKQSGEDVFGDGVKLQLQSTDDDDANHFDPRYFGKNKKWHNPNVREMKIGFSRAASYIEQRGGKLRNATVGGDLNEVSRVDFETLFTR